MQKVLTKKAITAKMKSLHQDWTLSASGTSMDRKYAFQNYLSGFIFVTKVSIHAEVLGHHPEITLSYGFVKIMVTTTETKSLTLADFELAQKCDALFALSTTKVKSAHTHY